MATQTYSGYPRTQPQSSHRRSLAHTVGANKRLQFGGELKKSQDDLFNKGDGQDDPFQTMYQKTFGASARVTTSQAVRRQPGQYMKRSSTSHANLTNSSQQQKMKQNDNRKFGQYEGADGQEPSDGIWKQTGPFQQLPIGYEGVRNTRCTDRFVKYPYPKVLYSNYRQNYYGKINDAKIQNHKNAFNLEKEAKIINPHRMDLATTHGATYQGKKGLRAQPKHCQTEEKPAPIVQMSSYQASFPNWDNGKADVFHEKHPQYPYYCLPFAGESTYKQNFTDSQLKELKRQQEINGGTNAKGATSSLLKVKNYKPQTFGFQTTNSQNFKDFRLVPSGASGPERVQPCAPLVHPVQTKVMAGHFDTTNKKNLKKHGGYSRSAVDHIPYP